MDRPTACRLHLAPQAADSTWYPNRFLAPLESQVAQSDGYYDPDLTPEGFLPWLATWIGVAWDDSLPVARQRRLLGEALRLYQKRGTRAALEEYLRIYSGGEVEIVEHRAQNFSLGMRRAGARIREM